MRQACQEQIRKCIICPQRCFGDKNMWKALFAAISLTKFVTGLSLGFYPARTSTSDKASNPLAQRYRTWITKRSFLTKMFEELFFCSYSEQWVKWKIFMALNKHFIREKKQRKCNSFIYFFFFSKSGADVLWASEAFVLNASELW